MQKAGEPYSPEIEVLGIAIADRPGTETVEESAEAHEFARVFRDDFDAVLILDCAGRSPAALAGDLGAQLALRLDGPLAANIQRLHEFCSERRLLVVLEGANTAAADPFIFGGRCSTLISTGESDATSADPIRAAQDVVARGTAPWPELCKHARTGRRMLHGESRLAELLELMQRWHELATARRDRAVTEEAAREMVWIFEEWGDTDRAREMDLECDPPDSDQMILPFG